MMITQHSVIINNYRTIKRVSPAHAQMAPASQRSFKTIVSEGLVGQSLMLFRIEYMHGPNIKEIWSQFKLII